MHLREFASFTIKTVKPAVVLASGKFRMSVENFLLLRVVNFFNFLDLDALGPMHGPKSIH